MKDKNGNSKQRTASGYGDRDNSKWVTYEEAKNYDLIEGILEEIGMVDKILRNKN